MKDRLSRWGRPYRELLESAALQFKLALAVSATSYSRDEPAFDSYDVFSFGRHTVSKDELSLSKDQERNASTLLEHSTTYLLAVQLDSALEELVPNRFDVGDSNIRCAARICRLVRNAFAHNPFAPTWKIPKSCRNQTYNVTNIISLNTIGLDGTPVTREHYGGPLALLQLLQYVKEIIDRPD